MTKRSRCPLTELHSQQSLSGAALLQERIAMVSSVYQRVQADGRFVLMSRLQMTVFMS